MKNRSLDPILISFFILSNISENKNASELQRDSPTTEDRDPTSLQRLHSHIKYINGELPLGEFDGIFKNLYNENSCGKLTISSYNKIRDFYQEHFIIQLLPIEQSNIFEPQIH